MAKDKPTTEPSGDAPAAETPTSTPAEPAGQENTTEVVGSDSAGVEAATEPEPKAKPRCEYTDDDGRRCRYEVHSDRYPHLLEEEAPPKIVTAAGKAVQVKRHTDNTWWCPICDNSQQMIDIAVCRKCGAIPKF